MAPRRLFVPGLSHHVYHRGNNRSDIFRDDRDRKVLLMIFGRAMRRSDIAVHAYALMDNHYHALVTSPNERALPIALQRFGRSYVRYFNERHTRTGTLWEGRYRASLILDERYWLTCMRYIELNPVAAGIVAAPEAYLWSSYHHHARGHDDPLLTAHPLFDELGHDARSRQMQWRGLCGQGVAIGDVGLINAALRSNAPLHEPGTADNVEDVEEETLFAPGS